ncbi:MULTISPECIES: relaxase/mobilization nuclease domain-containing protein [unclassified Mesorhizobium]|uniref:relaxase/mobilization nuclease domain-containing protein n=1 Tax=unclassified Mesorhizobium TaxID=325217 RepID=UPI002414E4B2|nr:MULTISPECIES: relaxase/mobilization nuclease domain-containing protein [unclassified Mesorhizobium]MDG4890039.1 relaxase/mobilization nuclease domain-containing protein [Mesorhizobium sp. WSM4887]MDG4904181.1 relaxase/mobilization nuclease domain-containing protein [Mesorhizobium sp. WSM4962]MDG4909208.1 relaxase/mobilization nuclease domain-containing protein [Mesorhizobium sp. WSM4898]MDG4921832.1 relaxase/mobilization nuclease domain-containing protein [Mesorhizobium sp. WSM4989]
MSGRLAGYAAEIERYLLGESAVKREDLDDDKPGTSARREAGEFQAMKSRERAGGAGRLGQGQAGSTVGGRRSAPRSSPGLTGVAGSSVSSAAPKSTAAASSPKAASAPIMIYGATLAGFRPEEEEEDWKRRGGGGGRGAGRSGGTGRAARAGYQALAVAARAGYAAGAQPAVFKVMPNPPSTKEAAARLLNYIGKREDEKGEKHDIEIFDEDGQVLATGAARKAFLETFCETFEPPLENTNFLEVRFELASEVADGALSEALNKAFGAKPFIYAHDGQTVQVYAHTDERAGPIARVLAGGRDNSRSKALDKIEARLSEAMGAAGVAAKAAVTAAVSREAKAKYFLQKFIRTHSHVRYANGEPVPGVKNSTTAAASVYEQWRPQFSGRERRNAYHLLFSARAGTDANAVMAAARAVLEERAPGYKFVLAHHKDTKHVHIHAMVQARSADGERLKFYKPDLASWRETFAEKARENGIAMVATRRMDHAMTRPFTKEHAGAYSRAQSDPRYQVSARTIERVEAKRQRRLDGQSLVVNGDAIVAAWQKTVTTMRTAGIVGQALMAAESIGSSFLRLRRDRTVEGQTGPMGRGADQSGQKSFLSHPGMRELNALIGDLNMAQTPLEMRRQMARVNQALDNMRQTLPPAHQQQFEQYREEVNDKMHDRLARLQFERQQQRRGGAGEPIPEREARGRDLPTRADPREPEEPRTGTDQEKVRAKRKDANKQKARQPEDQDRKTQRSNDNDYER